MTTRTPLWSLTLALALGCAGGDDVGTKPDDSSHADDTAPVETGDPPVEDETVCAEIEARLGIAACVPRVADDDTFEAITVSSSTVDQLRVGKYLVPAVDDARVPPVFLVVSNYELHYDFLVDGFPDTFAGLTTSEYEALTLYPDTREFFAGTLSLYLGEDGFFYGFTVWDDPSDTSTTVTQADVTSAWETLQARFEIGTLAFVPGTSLQIAAAEHWTDAPFEIAGLADVAYEAYNTGEAYGTIRLYDLGELEEATEDAEFGYQDILVLDEAPTDLERVVSGIVTGTRQGTLSHLSIRSAARGTPNCYIADPHDALADWDGLLVHFTCGEDDWSIEVADPADAAAWWDSIRPDTIDLCEPDTDGDDLPGLLELPTDTIDERLEAACRYGSKGTNLATLYQRLEPDVQYPGFLIPFHYYQEFVESTTWTVDLGDGEAEHTVAETIAAWHADEEFLTDAAVRRGMLDDLRDAMEDAEVDPALTEAVADRIVEVFGGDDVMVRMRSSSNAEDNFEFSGAGLYESESACVLDELDGDEDGPSACDEDKPDEQTMRHAITEVWASLWKMEAWEERDWYGMDQSKVAMGILVNTRSNNEQANIVAFSGNPTTDGDDRYLVNAQEGEGEVVSSEPGVVPEKVLITVEDGVATDIYRVSGSSETDDGEVLTDAELTELARVLYDASQVFPVDQEVPEGEDLLWDTEWKISESGQLIIKQIRPYLR